MGANTGVVGTVLGSRVDLEAVRIVGTDDASVETDIPILELPDEIDPGLNAFVITLDTQRTMSFEAYDEQGEVIAHGSFGPEVDGPRGPTTSS